MGRDLMKIREMLAELKRRRRSLSRAIAAIEALERKSRVNDARRHRAKGSSKRIEGKERQALNGTTGVLIPFSRGRRQR